MDLTKKEEDYAKQQGDKQKEQNKRVQIARAMVALNLHTEMIKLERTVNDLEKLLQETKDS